MTIYIVLYYIANFYNNKSFNKKSFNNKSFNNKSFIGFLLFLGLFLILIVNSINKLMIW